MTIRTSKSAFGTRKTSSQFGTAAQTDGTAEVRYKKQRARGRFAKLVTHLEDMPLAQFRKSLVAAGIITKTGRLRAKYQQAEKAKKR